MYSFPSEHVPPSAEDVSAHESSAGAETEDTKKASGTVYTGN